MIKFAEVLVKQFGDEVINLTSDLRDGKVKNMEQYKDICGQIRAWSMAIQYTQDLAKVAEEE
jgi:hypothetical protein